MRGVPLTPALVVAGGLIAAGLSVQKNPQTLITPNVGFQEENPCPDGCALSKGCSGVITTTCGDSPCGGGGGGSCGQCELCIDVCVQQDGDLCFGTAEQSSEEEQAAEAAAEAKKRGARTGARTSQVGQSGPSLALPKPDTAKQPPAGSVRADDPTLASFDPKDLPQPSKSDPNSVAPDDPTLAAFDPKDLPQPVVDPNAAPEEEKPKKEEFTPLSDQERELSHNHPTGAMKLPTGTCTATNEDVKGNEEAQLLWNNWCDEVCIAVDLGGIGAEACKEPSGTGAVGCICKQDVELISIFPPTKPQLRESQPAASPAPEPQSSPKRTNEQTTGRPNPSPATDASLDPEWNGPMASNPEWAGGIDDTADYGGNAFTAAADDAAKAAAEKQAMSNCVSISPSATDYWCASTCTTSSCPKEICKCGDEATQVTQAAATQAAASGDAQSPPEQNAQETAPTVKSADSDGQVAQYEGDKRNWGGNSSCVSIDKPGTSDYWCAVICASGACPQNICSCSPDALQAQAQAAQAQPQLQKNVAAPRSTSVDKEAQAVGTEAQAVDEEMQTVDKAVASQCVSLEPGVTDYWCVKTCSTGACPPTACSCPGGRRKRPKAEAAAAPADDFASVPADAETDGPATYLNTTCMSVTPGVTHTWCAYTCATGDCPSAACKCGSKVNEPGLKCVSTQPDGSDSWCTATCLTDICPSYLCKCGDEAKNFKKPPRTAPPVLPVAPGLASG